MDTDLDHARLVWRPVPTTTGKGAGAGAGAGRTYGAAEGKGRSRIAAARASRVFKSLGSGAQALREYTCDASSPKWETVHVSVKLP
eukprot:6175081-Pleurochrysis_carterae.AAC.5